MNKINYTAAIILRCSDDSLKTILLAEEPNGILVEHGRECDIMNVSMSKAIEMLTQYYEDCCGCETVEVFRKLKRKATDK